MKNREGFVSNSSSSSFIVVGATISIDEFKHLAKNHYDIDLYDEDFEDGAYGLPDEIKNTSLGAVLYEIYGDYVYLGHGQSLDDYSGLETDISSDTLESIQAALKEFNLKTSIIGGDYNA